MTDRVNTLHNKLVYNNAADDDVQENVIVNTANPLPVSSIINGENVSVQNPPPPSGDSVYCQDVWVDESIVTDWVDLDGTGEDIACIPFTDLHTAIQNTTNNNPKILRIHFNRAVKFNHVELGCAAHPLGTFSNVKITSLNPGEKEVLLFDDSLNNTKETNKDYQFGPSLANAIKIEFYTVDDITISTIIIQKIIETTSTLRALKPDGSVTNIDATASGNLKVAIEEIEPSATVPFNQLVAEGLIPRYSTINKFGQNNNLNTATYEDIWDGGGIYPYPADNTAPITELVSSDNGDTQIINVQGLDITGALVVQDVTATGTTPVILTTPLWRVFRLKNLGTVDNAGDICVTSTGGGTDYACMATGNNQTLMALFTIPLNKTGYLYFGTNNLSDVTRGVSASGRLTMRPFGGVFQLKKTFGVSSDGSGFIGIPSPIPGSIPALTDIKVSAIGSANGVSLNTTFDILLKDD